MNCTDIDFELAPNKMRTEECGFQNKDLKVGDKGIIQTPNYPNDYPPDIQCIWWLKVRINPIPTRLGHVMYCNGDKSYPCLVGIGLSVTHSR